MPYIALARQDKTYRNISDALGRLRIDHQYFSTYANTYTSECIADKKRKGSVKVAKKIHIQLITFNFYFLLCLFISGWLLNKRRLSLSRESMTMQLFPKDHLTI